MQSTPWPQRPMLFAALGAFSAIAIYYLTDGLREEHAEFALRIATATAITTFSLTFAIVTRRDRLAGGIIFALLVAAMVAGISYWRLHIDWPHVFSFLALAVALFVCSPFYQTALHSEWRNYKALHHHAWSNAVIVPLGVLFVALTFAMAYLIAELFSLVGIDQLKDLLRQDIVRWFLAGTALGASIGTLREHESIIASTQRLVQSVFSLLTTPLALGLGGFLLVLPFTGLESLWNNTRNTSATLFSCALAALVFLNSVVREDSENQSNNRLMQLSARLLALCLAPLALIAALAIKLRVEQYGWTPDRIWATVICSVLIIYGIFYIAAALRKLRFNESIRQTNIYLALLVCVLALVLATPLLDFGKYSAKDQLTRLKDGRITEEKLDIIALAHDFGPAGRDALDRLKSSVSPETVAKIDKITAAKSRRAAKYLAENQLADNTANIRIMTGPDTIPDRLLQQLKNDHACKDGYCYLFWSEDETEVTLVNQTCITAGSGECQPRVHLYRLNDIFWYESNQHTNLNRLYKLLPESEKPASRKLFINQLDAAAKEGKLELRPVQRTQLYIDGVPVGPIMK